MAMDVPPHVPRELVFDFDFHTDQRLRGDPQRGFRSLYDLPSIFYAPHYGGHWVISGYETVFEALHSPDIFSSEDQHIPPSDEPQFGQIPVMQDPPEHTVYRRLISPLLSPKAVGALEARTRVLASELIEGFKDRGECDFVRDFAALVPVTIFLKLMDLPTDKLEEFRRWSDDFFSAGTEEALRAANDQILAYISGHISSRRGSSANDFISALWREEVHGRPITQEEMEAICMLLFIAGTDTVTNTLGFSMRYIAEHPEFQERIASNPSEIPEAVEECLRLFSTSNVQRRVACDTTFRGVTMKRNDMAVVLTSTAGADSEITDNADTFMLDRGRKQHLAFGAGPHRCAGSHLARIELKVCLQEWFNRIPHFRIKPAAEIPTRAGTVMGIMSLPLTWDL